MKRCRVRIQHLAGIVVRGLGHLPQLILLSFRWAFGIELSPERLLQTCLGTFAGFLVVLHCRLVLRTAQADHLRTQEHDLRVEAAQHTVVPVFGWDGRRDVRQEVVLDGGASAYLTKSGPV